MFSNWWLGQSTPSRYQAACLPYLHRNQSKGDKSRILCQCPYRVVRHECSDKKCRFVDDPDDDGECNRGYRRFAPTRMVLTVKGIVGPGNQAYLS